MKGRHKDSQTRALLWLSCLKDINACPKQKQYKWKEYNFNDFLILKIWRIYMDSWKCFFFKNVFNITVKRSFSSLVMIFATFQFSQEMLFHYE